MSVEIFSATGFQEDLVPRSVEYEATLDSRSMSYEQASLICQEGILNSATLAPAIELGFFDPGQILNACILDLQVNFFDDTSVGR